MFQIIDIAIDEHGNAQPNWQLEVYDIATGLAVPLYADYAGAIPIEQVSFIPNRAVSDIYGNITGAYVASGTYGKRYYDTQGVLRRTVAGLDMYGAENAAAAAASAATATTQAGIATTQATNAAASATSAATSATSAATSATSASTSAAIATTQAGAVAAAMNSSSAPYANAYASALPQGVLSTTITAAGTGGTSGTYALGVSGGPTGFAGTYTISGGGVTAITITNPGLSTTNTAPTLSFPSGSVTGATATATVGSLVADQKTYWVASADSSQILLYGNNGGSVATAPFGGTQLAMYGKGYFDTVTIGTLSISTSGNVTLSTTQAGYGALTFTGSPASNITVTVPNTWRAAVTNSLGSSRTITVKTAAGTGIVVPNGGTFRLRANGTNVINEDANSYNARRVVIGRIIARSYDGSNNLVVTGTGGSVYSEALGTREFTIASFSNTVIGADQALVADPVSGSVDGNGNIIPTVVSLASTSQTGWQTGRKVIVIANRAASSTVKQYGGAYVIDCPDPDADALTNSRRARRVVDGRVVKFVASGSTCTISTTQGRVWDQGTGGVATASINPVTDVTLAAKQALVVDLDGTPDGSGFLTPTVVDFTSAGQTGWQYGNKIVLFSMANVGISSSDTAQTKLIYGGGEYTLDVKVDPSRLQVLQTPGVVKVMQKSSDPNSLRYTRWALIHRVDAGTNTDLWHNEGLWDSALISGQENKLQSLFRGSGAEMETAVSVNSTTTFVGGWAHRYQKIKLDGSGNPMISMFIDGVKQPIDDSTTATFEALVVDVYQTSTLYFYGTSTPLAEVYTHWRWTREKLVLEVTYKWLASARITYAYTGIIPIYRTATIGAQGGEGTGSTISITDSGMRSPAYAVEVLSTDTYPEVTSDSANCKLWGSAGYHFEVNFTRGWTDPTRQFRFDPQVYNKPYHSIIYNKDVANGDLYTVEAEIIVHNPN